MAHLLFLSSCSNIPSVYLGARLPRFFQRKAISWRFFRYTICQAVLHAVPAFALWALAEITVLNWHNVKILLLGDKRRGWMGLYVCFEIFPDLWNSRERHRKVLLAIWDTGFCEHLKALGVWSSDCLGPRAKALRLMTDRKNKFVCEFLFLSKNKCFWVVNVLVQPCQTLILEQIVFQSVHRNALKHTYCGSKHIVVHGFLFELVFMLIS